MIQKAMQPKVKTSKKKCLAKCIFLEVLIFLISVNVSFR